MRSPIRYTRARRLFVATISTICVFEIPIVSLAQTPPHAQHVVVVVFDGLRPDSVTEKDMPTLYAMSQRGVRFDHHHPVYPSSTEVNGTAIATGGYPTHTGIMSNREYRPDLQLMHPIETQDAATVRKGDLLTNGRYLTMPTLAEILRRANLRTVVAGTKPVALLLDRSIDSSPNQNTSVDLYQGNAVPVSALSSSSDAAAFPQIANPKVAANAAQDRWTTRILVERLWGDTLPAFTVLWLSEPDFAQHGSGPGSDVARAALRSSDDNLALVLQSLDARHLRDQTDVMLVSDHGFSTISRSIEVAAALNKAGFDAANEFTKAPTAGQVMVAGNGGSVSLYVTGHDDGEVRRIVKFLQQSDFAGVIFTRKPLDGTFTLSQAGIETPQAPDIIVAMRWTNDKSATGMPGLIVSEGLGHGPGQGNHASLSPSDMHNTLIAEGPDFKKGFIDELPSGNSDVAPTVLHILGVKPQSPMDGRVLSEALINAQAPDTQPQTTTLKAMGAGDTAAWKQYLRITKLGDAIYLDEGNAGTR